MKAKDKPKVLTVLVLFGLVMLFFTGTTVYEYFRFKDGVSVQGVVTDIDSRHSGRGGRRWYADVTATIAGVEVSERFPLPRGGVKIGGVRVSSIDIVEGDSMELLAVREGDSYDIAVADDVRRPWAELAWEIFTIALISFCLIHVIRK